MGFGVSPRPGELERRDGNAGAEGGSEAADFSRVDWVGPLQLEPSCLQRRPGYPGPNRAPGPDGIPSGEPFEPHRLGEIRGHVQPTHRVGPQSRRAQLAPVSPSQQQQFLFFSRRFLLRLDVSPSRLPRLQPFLGVGNSSKSSRSHRSASLFRHIGEHHGQNPRFPRRRRLLRSHSPPCGIQQPGGRPSGEFFGFFDSVPVAERPAKQFQAQRLNFRFTEHDSVNRSLVARQFVLRPVA